MTATVLETARTVLQQCQATVKHTLKNPLSSRPQDLHSSVAPHTAILRIAEALESSQLEQREFGLLRAQEMFPTALGKLRLEHPEAIAKAKELILEQLEDSTKSLANKMGEVKKAVERVQNHASATEEAAGKGGSFFERIGNWANDAFKMEGASNAKRLAFGAGCIGLGSLFMYVSGEWLGQAWYGQSTRRVDAMDETGHPTAILVPRPLSSTERIVKGAAGVVGFGGGLVGFNAGFHHMFHGR